MVETALHRRDVVAQLLAADGEVIAVSGLGSSTWDLHAAGDRERNFYLWGAMGSAALIGLGFALARPDEKVLVITGDGEQLMGTGGLATIGVQNPANLSIVMLDNGHFGETGMQRSHTSLGVDLVGIAAASGIARTEKIGNQQQLETFKADMFDPRGTSFASVRVIAENYERSMPTLDGNFLKNRIRETLNCS